VSAENVSLSELRRHGRYQSVKQLAEQHPRDETRGFESGSNAAEEDLRAAAAPARDERSWIENYLRNENRWLRSEVERLERQLQRRTITLVLSGVIAAVAAGFGLVSFYESELLWGESNESSFSSLRVDKQTAPAQVQHGEPNTPSASGSVPPAVAAFELEESEESLGSEPATAGAAPEESGGALQQHAKSSTQPAGPAVSALSARKKEAGETVGTEPAGVLLEKLIDEHRGLQRNPGSLDPAPDVGQQVGTGATAEPEYYVATDPVNFRAAPDNAGEVLAVLKGGDLVRSIGRKDGWLQVEYTDRFANNFTGWVHSRYLRRIEASSQQSGSVGAGG
jgi:hypothetical protein